MEQELVESHMPNDISFKVKQVQVSTISQLVG